jgi:hypothetical protein
VCEKCWDKHCEGKMDVKVFIIADRLKSIDVSLACIEDEMVQLTRFVSESRRNLGKRVC